MMARRRRPELDTSSPAYHIFQEVLEELADKHLGAAHERQVTREVLSDYHSVPESNAYVKRGAGRAIGQLNRAEDAAHARFGALLAAVEDVSDGTLPSALVALHILETTDDLDSALAKLKQMVDEQEVDSSDLKLPWLRGVLRDVFQGSRAGDAKARRRDLWRERNEESEALLESRRQLARKRGPDGRYTS